MADMPQQGLGYWGMLANPQARAVDRAQAVAGLGAGGPQVPQGMPGMAPEPPKPSMVPPMPMANIPAAFDAGRMAAEGQQQPLGFARGGPVQGYAHGGPVQSFATGGPVRGMNPLLLMLTKQMMPTVDGEDDGGDDAEAGLGALYGGGADAPLTGEDKGLALAQAGFSMAAGNSHNPLQNLGAGASAGIESLMKLRQQRALQRMREAQMMGTLQLRADEIGVRKDIAAQASRDRIAAIQERADAARQRSEDANASREDRAQAARELAQYRQDLLDLRRGTGASTLPEGTGDNFLEQLPEADQAVVKKVAAGEIDPRSLTQRDGYRNRIIAATSQFDPAYDQSNVGARFQLKKDFASGKSAQNITSANTLIGHLASLKESADKLKNTDYPAYNTVANWMASNTGDPRVKDFNTKRQAVADELTRLFRGTGGTLTEIQEWQSNIGSAGSPAQLDAVISSALELMRSRVGSLADQYNRGFGTQKTADDFLSPNARKIINKLDKAKIPEEEAAPAAPGIVAPAVAAPTGAPPAATAAPIKSLIDQYRSKPGG